MVAIGFFLASLLALAHGNPLTRRAMVVHEERATLPAGFVKAGPASPDAVLQLRIALRQNNPEGLTEALMDVSTPGNAQFAHHLTKEEVRGLLLCILNLL